MKKILILYTSVGLGHKSIAENIADRLRSAGFEVKLEDILQVQKGWLVSVGKFLHHVINFYLPFLWSFLYQSDSFTDWSLKFRTRVAANNMLNTQMILDSFEPDAVIATQTTASAVVSALKSAGKYKNLFGIAFSDYHLHRYWLYDNSDFYLANIPEQKTEMVRLGIAPEKIFVCGMSLPEKKQNDPATVREKFGFSSQDKVVLVGGGSLGYGLDSDIVFSLSAQSSIKVIVVCGKNQKIFSKLTDFFAGQSNVTVLGFYQPMEDLYALADIFITKPGGLSVAEAVSWQLPILVSHFLPGQEELNYEYLQDKAIVMPEPINLAAAAQEELESGAFRQSLGKNRMAQIVMRGEILVEKVMESLLHGHSQKNH
jgi:processive 1,2-diacylglycerol beta-glucosyltransferase